MSSRAQSVRLLNQSIERSNSTRRGERAGGSLSSQRMRDEASLDKFDFPCFISFLIKLGPKVYPHINENHVSIKNLIEDFILPLYGKVSEAKLEQN